MSRRVLITGLNGFVGPYLARALHDAGYAVAATHYGPMAPHPVALPPLADLVELDVRSAPETAACLARIRPDGIVHLAGFSEPHKSVSTPLLTTEVNVMGTVHVLEALRAVTPSARCVVVGSGDVYGDQRENEPAFTEESPLRPRNPYAVTKAAADWMAEIYARAPHSLDIVRVRPFNHTGPGQQRGLVCPDFAYGIAEIAASGARAGTLAVGNLDSTKDFTDVRDVVRGYVRALEDGERGAVYNLASGRSVRVREIFDTLVGIAGLDVEPVPNPAFAGAAASQVLANAERFRSRTGWSAEIPLERTLRDLFDHCRASVTAH